MTIKLNRIQQLKSGAYRFGFTLFNEQGEWICGATGFRVHVNPQTQNLVLSGPTVKLHDKASYQVGFFNYVFVEAVAQAIRSAIADATDPETGELDTHLLKAATPILEIQ